VKKETNRTTKLCSESSNSATVPASSRRPRLHSWRAVRRRPLSSQNTWCKAGSVLC